MHFNKMNEINQVNTETVDGIQRSLKAFRHSRAHPESINELVSHAQSQSKNSLKTILQTLALKTAQKNTILHAIPEQYVKAITDHHLARNKLCLFTANAAIATQLRYIKTDILHTLRKSGLCSIINIEIKVKP